MPDHLYIARIEIGLTRRHVKHIQFRPFKFDLLVTIVNEKHYKDGLKS